MPPSNDTTVVLRIPQELKESLQGQAEVLDVSLSEVIRMKLMIADSAVHREPVIRLGERKYRLHDLFRGDVLEYDIVDSTKPLDRIVQEEPGRHVYSAGGVYTDAVKEAFGLARLEAIRLGAAEIAPVHIVLALLAGEENNARRIVAHLVPIVRTLVSSLESDAADLRSAKRPPKNGMVALTRRAEKVVKLMYLEAKRHRRQVIDSSIMLLALLRDGDGSADTMARFGVTYDAVRALLEK